MFALSLNVKQFYLTHRLHPFRCYHFFSEWTREQWQWRVTLHYPKLQHYWCHTIRFLMSYLGWGLTPLQRCSRCISKYKLTGLSFCWGFRRRILKSANKADDKLLCLIIFFNLWFYLHSPSSDISRMFILLYIGQMSRVFTNGPGKTGGHS